MIIARAPVRISFFGGGTDYPEHFLKHGGAVLATAIDKYSYVTASKFQSHLFDYSVRVSYRKVELVKRLDEIEHRVFRECLRLCGLDRDIELHNVADLPSFTGLGSSSTFTVSLLQALHSFKHESLEPLQLGYEAIQVERGLLNESVGCQDQILAAVGGFNIIEFRKEDDIVVRRIPLSAERLIEFEEHLVVMYTGITRKAADIASAQLRRKDQNLSTLLQMRNMVDQGCQILTGTTSLAQFGELLHKAWAAKKSLESGISNGQIDELYDRARQSGAWGGKLLGAGGGGFLLLFAPPEKHAQIKMSFPNNYFLQVKTNAPGVETIFSSM
jgi:D-glycero-alpha-D-manno-heptose-7-phosphate kinase